MVYDVRRASEYSGLRVIGGVGIGTSVFFL